MSQFKIHSNFYRALIFWVGILATICYRLIIFLNHLPDRIWSDLVWYLGTLGFVWYFAHRYRVENARANTIRELDLETKVLKSQTLTAEDRTALAQTLRSLESSTAQWLYVVIFVSSGLALALDLMMRYWF
jgi:hypothetical protein